MSEHDNFDNFLRQQLQGSQPYLPDDGFTAGVMAAMPHQQPVVHPWAYLIVFLPFIVITLLILNQLPWREALMLVCQWSLSLDYFALLKMGLMGFGCFLVLGVTWLIKQVDWV